MCDNKQSGNIMTDLSDPFSQFASVKRDKIDFKKINGYRRDFTRFSDENFRYDISLINFKNDYHDVNDKFSDFISKLEVCVEQHAPLKKLTSKQLKFESKPWITSEIQRMIKIRNKLFYKKKKQPNNENNKRLYNLFRNRINRELKKSKKDFYCHYFEINKNSIKKKHGKE